MSRSIGWALWLYVPAVGFLAAVGVAATASDREVSTFTLDPAVLLGASPFLGVASNLGILLWAGTAAITLFTAMLLQRRDQQPDFATFLRGAGLLTGWLLLDDLFLFHEWLFPIVLGIPQALVLIVYCGAVALFLRRYVALILRTDYWLLVLALAWFSLSVGVDQLATDVFARNVLYFVEDGAKLLGIVGWLGYFVRVSALSLGSERPPATL